MLNSHPDVFCPSEHQLEFLHKGLTSLFENYNKALQLVDRRTGGGGYVSVEVNTQQDVFRCAVELMLKNAACGKQVMGANDNAILKSLEMYGALFDSPKMLCIFRNPVDAGVSAWHHNLRLASEEHPGHKRMMMQYGGFDGWLRQYARWFSNAVEVVRAYASTHHNIKLVRYEDLVTDAALHMVGIFRFLGVEAATATVNAIVEKTSFAVMKKESPLPGFFRSASIAFGGDDVTVNLRKEIAAIAGDALESIGYDVESSRVLGPAAADIARLLTTNA